MTTNNSINLPDGTNGQFPIATTGGFYTPANLTSLGGTITVTNGAGTVDIAVTSPGAAGAWEWVSNTVVSSDASVAFTDLSSSYSYLILIEDLMCESESGPDFAMYQDDDNGASYAAWSSGRYLKVAAGGVTTDTDDDEMIKDIGDTQHLSGQIFLYAPAANHQTVANYRLVIGSGHIVDGYFYQDADYITDAVKIQYTDDDIASGTVRLYRLAQS